jgi:hypothetical protein
VIYDGDEAVARKTAIASYHVPVCVKARPNEEENEQETAEERGGSPSAASTTPRDHRDL